MVNDRCECVTVVVRICDAESRDMVRVNFVVGEELMLTVNDDDERGPLAVRLRVGVFKNSESVSVIVCVRDGERRDTDTVNSSDTLYVVVFVCVCQPTASAPMLAAKHHTASKTMIRQRWVLLLRTDAEKISEVSEGAAFAASINMVGDIFNYWWLAAVAIGNDGLDARQIPSGLLCETHQKIKILKQKQHVKHAQAGSFTNSHMKVADVAGM